MPWINAIVGRQSVYSVYSVLVRVVQRQDVLPPALLYYYSMSLHGASTIGFGYCNNYRETIECPTGGAREIYGHRERDRRDPYHSQHWPAVAQHVQSQASAGERIPPMENPILE